MAYSENQARDANGKFASGGNAGEQAHRNGGRFPVAPHAGARSVATHAGYQVAQLNEKTQAMEVSHGGRRRAVAESIARGVRADKGFARVR
jgi:hypothetical protein